MKFYRLFILSFIAVLGISFTDAYSQNSWPLEATELSVPDIKNNGEVEEFTDSLSQFYDFLSDNPTIRLAVVLSDIYSKKDMEFTRGMLLGMKHSGMPEGSVSLKIINGQIPEDSLRFELSTFEPDVIISTFEKDTPISMNSYSQLNSSTLINAFSTKGDDYLYNKNSFQLLSPSDVFNQEISKYILENFKGNTLVLIGEPDPTDTQIRELILSWPEEELMIVDKSDLKLFSLDEGVNYLIYPLSSSKDEVTEILKRMLELLGETPSAGLKIFGRPNWIAFNDLPSLISNLELFLPAKCYFDPQTESSKRFIVDYNTSYGHTPIRSYPVYAVMGYDTATYFFPKLYEQIKGNEIEWEDSNRNQSFFSLKKSERGGHYNSGSLILHYEPWGTISKVLINED